MMRTLLAMARRDLVLALRRRSDVMTTLVFFVIVVSLFPLGMGPDLQTLRLVAPGVMWVAALLASMMSLSRLFADDHRDGTLEQIALAPQPLALMVLGKVAAHWLTCGLPLVLIAPLLGLQFGLPPSALAILVIALALGTPTLSLVGAIAAALTLGVRSGGVLIALLTLPLYVPVLVFGAGAVEAAAGGVDAAAHLSLLGALLTAGLALAPWGASVALRIALE